MKKINTYSAQNKIIRATTSAASPEQPAELPAQLHNQNHAQSSAKQRAKLRTKNTPNSHKKQLSKDRQEFINTIAASGFKQFNL